METKQDIRKYLLQQRNSLPEELRQKYSTLITEKLIQTRQYQSAEVILSYISYQSEVSTHGFLKQALNNGKKIFVPKVLGEGKMEFFQINSLPEVRNGYRGILEPSQENEMFEAKDIEKVLMIMPLVGFDESNNRLGYGKGFYDRYLQRVPQMETIALAFETQKYSKPLPINQYDRKAGMILTEEKNYVEKHCVCC